MKWNQLAASVLVCLLSAGTAAPAAFADGETSFERLTSVPLKTYLVMDSGSSVPGAALDYTLSPGQAVEGTSGTRAIFAGPDGAVFRSSEDVSGNGSEARVRFSPADQTVPEKSAPPESSIGFATKDDKDDEIYVEKTLSIDLSGVSFPQSGIYRYVVAAETSDFNGVVADAASRRYVDVYVFKTDADTFVPAGLLSAPTTAPLIWMEMSTQPSNLPDLPTGSCRIRSVCPSR